MTSAFDAPRGPAASVPPPPSHGDPTSSTPAEPATPPPDSPPPPPPTTPRHDLTDILDQLHDDLHVEQTATPTTPDAPLTDPRDLDRPISDTIVIESTGGLEFRPDFASFGARFGGALIDGVILSLAMVPGVLLIRQASGGAMTLVGVLVLVLGFFVVNLWYARSVARSGQWIGNRIAKTRVVDSTNGSNLDVTTAGARFATRHLISVIFLFGFFPALTDSQRRTFHDRVASSVVVGRERATWSAGDDRA